jgi:hypothetical protein
MSAVSSHIRSPARQENEMTETYMGPEFRPTDYQRGMLEIVGEDDPAAIQAAASADWRRILDEAGDDLAVRPAPGEWSVLELLGHAVDGEIVAAVRYRADVAEDRPDIMPFDQDDWVAALHGDGGPESDPDTLLATLAALRAANLGLWVRTSDDGRRRVGMHRERGPESFGLQFVLIAGHDRFHLDQARRTLETVRAGRA